MLRRPEGEPHQSVPNKKKKSGNSLSDTFGKLQKELSLQKKKLHIIKM